MITRDNYEVYFVDYFDGKFSSDEIEGLLRFLSENSDLEEEFYSLLEMSPEADLQWSDFAPETIKRDSRSNFELSTFDYLCIADVENEIAESDAKMLQDSVAANTKLKHDLDLYRKTKLPEETIVFPNKEALKKNVFAHKRTRRMISYSSIAAAVTLVMLFALNEGHNLEPIAANQPSAGNTAKQSEVVEQNIRTNAAMPKQRSNKAESAATRIAKVAVSNTETANNNELAANIVADTSDSYMPVKIDETQVLNQIAYNATVKVEAYSKSGIDVEPVATMSEEDQGKKLLASISDFKVVNSVSSLVSKGNEGRAEVVNAVAEYKGRKKGILVARFINGVNSIFGTNIEYSSKYTVDGKLVALDIQAGRLSYGKKNDIEK